MTPQELTDIKFSARLAAVESLLAGLLTALTQSEASRQSLLAALDQLVETSSRVHFPEMKPEYSDLLAAEAQEAAEKLAAFVKSYIAKRPLT